MKESSTYQAILREGIQLGRQEGQLRTLHGDLQKVLRKRFGTLSNDLESRIGSPDDPTRLEEALLQSISIEKPEDLTL